jgi:hypothetical protein
VNPYQRQIDAAVRATLIRPPATCYWYGLPGTPVPRRLRGLLDEQQAHAHLVAVLTRLLYTNFYRVGAARPVVSGDEVAPPRVRGLPAFVHQLRTANAGRGFLVGGWHVERSDQGALVAARDGLRLRIDQAELGRGATGSLRFPREFVDASPGFYLATSDIRFAPDEAGQLVRLYWHFTPAGAVRFLAGATRLLNQAGVGFQLKTVNDPAGFDRSDNTVLYLDREDYPAAADLLRRLYRECGHELRGPVPALTKPLAPGVGLAEDPGPAQSFGTHRCRLIAEGIVAAYQQGAGRPEPAEVRRRVEQRFVQASVGLGAPYLNPGSRDDFPGWAVRPRPGTRQRPRPRDRGFLTAAGQLADRLCRRAIWHRDRCTWLAPQAALEQRANGLAGRAWRPLTADLYQGTSGVGLFLAEFAARTGDRPAGRTAVGALRHALAHQDRLAGPAALGLYTGWSGLGYAATRAGQLLKREELVAGAAQLATVVGASDPVAGEHDLLSGRAGAIVALLRLADLLGRPVYLDAAVRHGERLAAAACAHRCGDSWPAMAAPGSRNLTGLSHGTAGIASAFAALFAATGDTRYQAAARRAVGYERRWYDEAAGNWPDFRRPPGVRRVPGSPRSFAVAWCHGAPGIALSRLHAARVLGDPGCVQEAQRAIATTCLAVRHDLRAATSTLSLCHGTVGNADVLLSAALARPEPGREPGQLARQVGEAVLERWTLGEAQTAWDSEWQPGLMLGSAGTGLFLLRLDDSLAGRLPDLDGTPSVLEIFAQARGAMAG